MHWVGAFYKLVGANLAFSTSRIDIPQPLCQHACNMATQAKGVIARIPGAAAQVEDFTIDDPGPNEALVKILASGVCHTDLGVKLGTYGTDGFPFLLGHEGHGLVQKLAQV